jgi:cytochrome b subunit of formate dehydrogenase
MLKLDHGGGRSARRAPGRAALGAVAGMLLALSAVPAAANLRRAETAGQGGSEKLDCSTCHDQGQKLKNSAHASISCDTCHPQHEQYPHPANIPKPQCGSCHSRVAQNFSLSVHALAAKQGNAMAPNCSACHGDVHEVALTTSAAFRQSVPNLCGVCHSDIADQYKASVHGAAVAEGVVAAPVCTTCHGEHQILPPQNAASPVYPRNIPATCGQCHGNVLLNRRFGLPPDRVVSFQDSFHGMALKAGNETVANCSSCHGVHNILPSSDPRSTINPKNLPTTCGKCHPGAGTRFALGPIHELPQTEPRVVNWARIFYLSLIPLVIGLMLVHNLGDWLHKFRQRRFMGAAGSVTHVAGPGEPGEVRMFGFERAQHMLLILSFSILVWTGFALKYPDGWWARPLLAWESRWPVRGIVHRIAAVIFMAVAGMHLISLIVNRRYRRHWRKLWPAVHDVREGFANFAYNVGLRSTQPQLSSHSYIEKAEYWAVVWGSVVMAITGLMLWANKITLKWLPKSILDLATTVHFYEAVLAALAILVWHFYSVIFDPDVYPMETAWLTGRSVKPARGMRDEDEEPKKIEASQVKEATEEGDKKSKSKPSDGAPDGKL